MNDEIILKIIKDSQWSMLYFGEKVCPCCRKNEKQGHIKDCYMGDIIAKLVEEYPQHPERLSNYFLASVGQSLLNHTKASNR